MIQTHLGCVQYPDSGEAAKARRQLQIEKKLVFERLHRLVRAVIDCKGHDRDSVGTKTALELARALSAESWEGRATQLTQVPNIGPVGMRKLASKNIRTVLELADKDYDEIERLMSRQPPFGKTLQTHLEKFPRLDMELEVVGLKKFPSSQEPVIIEVKATLRYLNRKGPPHWLNRAPILTFLAESGDGVLVYFWRGSIKKLDKQAGFELGFSVGLREVGGRVVCHFACEEIVGTIVSKELKHEVPASAFPAKHASTRTGVSHRSNNDSQEYADCDGIDDSDLIMAAEQAVSCSSIKHGTNVDKVDNDEYPSIDDLIDAGAIEQPNPGQKPHDPWADSHGDGKEPDIMSTTTTQSPVRLPNGRWQCNHACSGGALTRSGKPCTHRCCKEGLDKPRKRPMQRPKRTREEADVEPAADPRGLRPSQTRLPQPSQATVDSMMRNEAKRQKVRDTSLLSGANLAPTLGGLMQRPKTERLNVDIDVMDLECIDLSYLDDEDDDLDIRPEDIFRRHQKVNSGALRKPTPREMARKADDALGETGFSAENVGKVAGTLGASPPGARHTDYFDDDDFSIFDEMPSLETPARPTNAAAFRSGASDEVPYQGMPEKFVESDGTGYQNTDSSEPAKKTNDVATASENPSSSSLSVDGSCFEVASGEFQGGTTTASAKKEEKAHRDSNEPAWVAEFDPAFVDMFRGYVTFV